MKTTSHIIIVMLLALLMPALASANVYENRVKEALENISQKAKISNIGLTYSTNTDPETGQKDGELRVVMFKLGNRDFHLIDQAVSVYQQINADSREGEVPYLYTLWFNSDNKDRTYSGINLYYSHDNSILVGTEADNCYTVGFYLSENTDYRHTYTLEWNDSEGDSLKGRIITTFGPIKAKATSNGSKLIPFSFSLDSKLEPFNFSLDSDSYDKFVEQMQAGTEEKYQAAIEKALAAKEKALAAKEKAQAAKEKAQAAKENILDEASVVRGKVTDENGEPLSGALVLPVGRESGTTTEKNGEFSLNLPDYVKQIKVSYVGYKTQVLSVEPNMVITMIPGKSDDNELSDLFLRVPYKDKSLTPSKPDTKDWMKKLLFYLDKIQHDGSDSRYLYLSKLYELCKDTEGLDQNDLKIGMQQLASVYKQLKEKKKLKESELLFLESMVDLLENKTK
jgi:hypothetical protein